MSIESETFIVSKKAKILSNVYNLNESKILFSDDFQPEKFKVIEAPNEVIESLNRGDSLYIKGTEGSVDAVLCSGNKTYSLKKAETSNSCYLLPPSNSFKFEITSKSSEYYEVIKHI